VTYAATPYRDPTDVVGRRIGAYVIDSLLIGAVSLAFLVPMFLSASVEAPAGTVDCTNNSSFDSSFQTDRDQPASGPAMCFRNGDTVRYIPAGEENAFTAKAYGTSFGISFLNLVLIQGLTGASLGKLMLGLRVVREDGRRAGIGWMVLRWVLLFVDSICCILPGVVLVFTTKGHRRLGDMAAGTFVVRREATGAPLSVPGVNAPSFDGSGGAGYGSGYQGGYQGGGYQGGYGQPSWPAPPGAPSAGSPWTPPATTPTGPADAPAGDGPTWDPAREAYIQYDRELSAWLQWNDDAREWRPIDQ
jgi:uncharacterized RDD family membrane protein YckC